MGCVLCNVWLSEEIFDFSNKHFGWALCMNHQNFIRDYKEKSSPETIQLYLALCARGVPAQLEKFDGFKTIDIAIPRYKLNIEVDGGHHHFDSSQALTDLMRTYYSFIKGYYTIRIPNALVLNHLNDTARVISEMLETHRNPGFE